MAVTVKIPAGVSEIRSSSLYQWDYGQQLEIESTELPALAEIHFACRGMQSAIVRTGNSVSGKLVATIPDICLEQAQPIIAWIFAIDGNEGATIKTIIIPVIARTRPQDEASIPRDNTDAYTQFLTEVNAAVASLKAGDVVVSRALSADSADYASAAGTAQHAYTAENADFAQSAGSTEEARFAETAAVIVPSTEDTSSASSSKSIDKAGIYVVDIYSGSESRYYTAVIVVPSLTRAAYSTIAKDIFKDVSCQVVYNPQGTNEAGNKWGVLQIEHDSDYDYTYNFTKCVRIADIY